jgi:hypothetical protein
LSSSVTGAFTALFVAPVAVPVPVVSVFVLVASLVLFLNKPPPVAGTFSVDLFPNKPPPAGATGLSVAALLANKLLPPVA